MIVPGSVNPLLLASAAAAGGLQVSRSLRFNAPDSAYLSRAVSPAGNRKTFTLSFWLKKSGLTTFQSLFNSFTDTSNRTAINFDSSIGAGGTGDYLTMFSVVSGTTTNIFQTNALYRDPSSWYQFVIAVDTTQATSTNRVKLWVNGDLATFSTYNAPSQNADLHWNSAATHYFGVYGGSPGTTSYGFNGYLADAYHIDGQQLDPSSFTETDATTGQLIPKAFNGVYGSNGWHLDFADNSAATATTLGKDTSGNGNNFTPSNFSVTAGAGNDSLVDVPTSSGTDTGVGNEVRGNYCTWNPLDKGSNVTLTNGNLDVSTNSTWNSVRATFGITSGKWYWEYTMSAAGYTMVGIGTTAVSLAGYIGQSASGYAFYSLNGNKWNSGTAASYGNSFTTNDVVGVAFDADSGKIWFSKNGTWQASGDPAAGTNAAYTSIPSSTYFPTISQDNSLPASTGGTLNAGARSFAYTAPSGFKALCTTNLPAPLVTKPSTVMDVVLWTGNDASTRTLTGALNFSADLVWGKAISQANDNRLWDSVRGSDNLLISNTTDAETATNYLTYGDIKAGASAGDLSITRGSNNSYNMNGNGSTFVAWCWDAGSSTVTNTQGSITSSVRANATAGFSIITYTGTGSSATVGHGLGVAPSMIIVKARDNSSYGGEGWNTYHSGLSAGYAVQLNSTQAQFTGMFTSTLPTSTVFTLSTNSGVNQSPVRYVAYAFAPVVGYSSFGTFVPTGTTDSSFVYCGFRPRLLLVKQTSNSSNWITWDTARDSYNYASKELYPNLSDAEVTNSSTYSLDILSNGFKMRNPGMSAGSTWIYCAWAESPFNYARAR